MGRSAYQYLTQAYRVRAVDAFADGDHWQGDRLPTEAPNALYANSPCC